MPTLRELQRAYPGRSDLELLNRWNETHPGQPLENDPTFAPAEANVPPNPAPAPTLMQRVQNVAKAHPTLTDIGSYGTAGALGEMAAGALAPETGGLSLLVPPAIMALSNVAGGAMARNLKGESGTLGDAERDAVLGGAMHYAPTAINAAGRVAKAAAEHVPLTSGFWTPFTAGTKIGGKILDPILTKAGEASEGVRNFLQRLGRQATTPAEESVGGVRPPTKPWIRKSAVGVEKPYRAHSGVSAPPVEPQPGREVVNSAKQQLNSFVANPTGSVNDMMTNQRGLDWMNKEFEANNPIFRRMFGGEAPSAPSSMESLATAVENPANRGLTPQATERLMNVKSGGWQDVPLEGGSGAPTPTDWRFVPPENPAGSRANFVKEHAGKSQAEMAQELGVREGMMPPGTRITRIHKPLYPSGNSKTDKLVAAMRQREKLMGYKD